MKNSAGFTLMEIIVSTTIFAFAVVSVLSLFNYALKINRRAEALRQASQGMRNMMEFVAKDVRNGQINYSTTTPGTVDSTNCPDTYNNTWSGQSYLGLVNVDGIAECFYKDNNTNKLMYEKSGIAGATPITPSNFTVNSVKFFVSPVADPYAAGNPKIQPVVVVDASFTVQLPTGEKTPVYYQTTISTDKYDF